MSRNDIKESDRNSSILSLHVYFSNRSFIMSSFASSLWTDTSLLPANFLALRGREFFRLVEDLTSHTVAEILRIQAICNVRCFMLVDDILEVFNINSAELACVRKEACFHLNDDTYIVKLGISLSIRYLRELFLAKLHEQYPAHNKPTIDTDSGISSSTDHQNGTVPIGQKRSSSSSEQTSTKRGRK